MSDFVTVVDSKSFRLEISVLLELCEIENTPRSLSVYLLVKYKQYDQLFSLKCDPKDYIDLKKFKSDHLVTGFLTKTNSIAVGGLDLHKEAIATFVSTEEENFRKTNVIRLRYETDPVFQDLISNLSTMVAKILGPFTHSCAERCLDNATFGKGLNVGLKPGYVLSDKFCRDPTLTPSLYPFYKAILGERWHYHATHPKLVKGSRFSSVPKNYKSRRSICVEPLVNSFLQRGIGIELRARLSNFGINLESQERNQQLAKAAYKNGLCTLDLKNASNSMLSIIVFYLLGPWYHILELSRCDFTSINGDYHQNVLFSSMGNGYTFELETLIFSVVCFHVVPLEEWHNVSVYGDDIIVPAKYSKAVISVLEDLGFEVNDEKSFLAGNFYESCGCDFFKGEPVRPFFPRGKSESGIPYTMQLANAIRMYAFTGASCDKRYKKLWKSLFQKTSGCFKLHVPSYFGDVGFISDQWRKKPVELGWSYEVKYIKAVVLKKERRSYSFLLMKMHEIRHKTSPHPLNISTGGSVNNLQDCRGLFGLPRVSKTLAFEDDVALHWA